MNPIEDDPNALHAASVAAPVSGGQAGRTFTFQGKPLNRYSYVHRLAYNRLTLDRMTQLEADTYLVFLLTKTAREADMVRGEAEESKFRVLAGEWAEALPDQKNAATSILELAKSIREDIDKAESLEPDTPPTGNA